MNERRLPFLLVCFLNCLDRVLLLTYLRLALTLSVFHLTQLKYVFEASVLLTLKGILK